MATNLKSAICAVLTALLATMVFIGCGLYDDRLDPRTELRIRQDAFYKYIKPYPERFPNITVDDVWISHYFGTYNGSVVMMLEAMFGYNRMPIDYTVAGVRFKWGVHQWPHVWRNGRFIHGLQEAYDAGWLTKNHLRKIAARHNNAWK